MPACIPASPKTHVQALVKNKVKSFAEKAMGCWGSVLCPAVPAALMWQPWLKEDTSKSPCREEMQPVPPTESKGTNWSYWGCSRASVLDESSQQTGGRAGCLHTPESPPHSFLVFGNLLLPKACWHVASELLRGLGCRQRGMTAAPGPASAMGCCRFGVWAGAGKVCSCQHCWLLPSIVR